MDTKRGCSALGCGKQGRLQCSQCRAVVYCSEGCQNKNWAAFHKEKCFDPDHHVPLLLGVGLLPFTVTALVADKVYELLRSPLRSRVLKTVVVLVAAQHRTLAWLIVSSTVGYVYVTISLTHSLAHSLTRSLILTTVGYVYVLSFA